MLDYVQTFDVTTELDCETLETEAYPEYGGQELIVDVPDVFDDAYVLWDVRRAGTRADDDGVKAVKDRKERRGGQGIVLDDMNETIRDGTLA